MPTTGTTPTHGVVVVIDVIRAFTTAAVAFERGVTAIACAPSVPAARDLRRHHPGHLLTGEIDGDRPPDFDFGNSPVALSTAPLTGRRLIQATSNGTRGLTRPATPVALLAASARNVGATAAWITAHHPGVPCTLVCTGRTAEDHACARHLGALLEGSAPDPADLVAGIMQGAAEHARPGLAPDLPFCCDVDRSDFAMVGEMRAGHVLLTAA